MEIWLDTIDLKLVASAAKAGIVAGVTTNPSILSQTPHVQETLTELLDLQAGPVAVQVTAQDEDLYTQLITDHELLEKSASKFRADWQKTHGNRSLKDLFTPYASSHPRRYPF